MTKLVRVLLVGSAGRMGQTIVGLAKADAKIDIVALCDQGDALEPAITRADVIIDFSHASALDETCRMASKYKQPLVVGTTGYSAMQREKINECAKASPIVLASNFSVGVNTLFWLTRKAAELLGPDFGVEIIETHHVQKKDAPSGTAKTLAEVLQNARKIDKEIPIQSIREGEVVGEHTVIFTEPGERLELTHRASNREVFAKGALRAAQWIVAKPPGLYSMQDVLGLQWRILPGCELQGRKRDACATFKMRAGLALGSNIGERLEHLRAARNAIVDLAGILPPVLASPIYETEPVDCEPGAAAFWNAVLEVGYNGEAGDLLAKLKQIEMAMGRPADHTRNVSRKIDIDLLYFGEAKIDNEQMEVPHPRMHERQFVLQPLADIRPALILPGQTRPVRELLAQTEGWSKVVAWPDEW